MSIEGAVWQGNDSCTCDYGYKTVGLGYIVSKSHNHKFQFFCHRIDPSPAPIPQPEPITYCELNKQYSFRIHPNVTACVCPTNSNLVRPNFLVGTNTFTCVPVNIPTPVEYCAINTSHFYNFSQVQCTCPTDSYKFVQNGYGITGGQSFTCRSNYPPHPTPSPVIVQTCWDGSVVPVTSNCPARTSCGYYQYWNGYSCSDYYYQPYSPVISPVIQYPTVYDDKSYNGQTYYQYDSYDWNNVDWVYSY